MKTLAQILDVVPVITDPVFPTPPPSWFAVIFLLCRIGIPIGIAVLVLRTERYSLTRKLVVSFILIILFAFTFYLEHALYGNINILRLLPNNESPNYVYPEFT